MQFENTVTIDSPLEDVWRFLWDHERVFTCIRGFSETEVVEEKKRYTANVKEKVGPFKVSFNIDVQIEEVEKFQHIRLKAAGKDSKIAARFSLQGDLRLKKVSDSETELQFTTDVSIFGKLATLGNWIIKRKANEVMDDFVQSLKAHLEKDRGA